MATRTPFSGTAPTKKGPGTRDSRSSIPCQFFAQRRCRNGENCPFSHDQGSVEQQLARRPSATAVRGTTSGHITTSGDGRIGRSDDATPQLTRLGDSRSSVPCRFLLRGSCLKGDKCPFAHNLNDNDANTKDATIGDAVQAALDTEEASAMSTENWYRELNGALVSFGDGVVVTKVSFPSDFSAVRISHLPPDTTSKSVAYLLASLGFVVSVDCVRVIVPAPADDTTMNAMYSADVRVEDPAFAKKLCDNPAMKDNQQDGPRAVPITAPMPSQSTHYRRVDSKKIHCSWHKPTRTAWLNFGSRDIAAKVASRFSAGIYKVLNQAVHCVGPTRGEGFRNPLAWTIRLSDVPGPAEEADVTRDIPKGMAPRHIELSPASYDADLPTANKLIESLLLQSGPLEHWEGAHPDTVGKRFKAQARFLNDADARQAVKMFHNRPLPFGSKIPTRGKLTVQLVHSARLKILNRVYEAIQPEVAEHQPAWASKHLRYRAYDPAQGLRVLKIEGEVSADVANAKTTLERIIQGQVLMASKDGREEAVWAPSFAGAANGRAQRQIKQLEREVGIVIVRDKRRSQIRLLGPRAKCEAARPALRALARQELEATAQSATPSATESTHMIELDGQLLTRAFRGGYRAIAAAIGQDKVTLDIVSTPRRIIITGSGADFKVAQDILNGTAPQDAEPPEAESSDCAICWTPAENPVLLTPCKHVYCSGCFEDLCFAEINNNTSSATPGITCQGEAATCSEIITLTTIQEHLSSSALEDLLEASFKAHVKHNLTTLKYCPTPDCPQLYRASQKPGPGAGTGTERIFTCPSCLSAICTTCHVSHDNLSCSEHRDKLSGGQEALKKTKQQLGIKDCPKCGIMIEKTFGCNHMTCSACGAHICWFCLDVFPEGGLVYAHMNRKHNGNGLRG